jgi:hypothetical protein
MDAREIFFIVGSATLILISALVIFFFYSLYRIGRMARNGMHLLNVTARDIQSGFGALSRTWGKASLVGIIFNLIRFFIRRRT